MCCRTPLKAPPPDTASGTVGPRFSNYSHAPLLLLGGPLQEGGGTGGVPLEGASKRSFSLYYV